MSMNDITVAKNGKLADLVDKNSGETMTPIAEVTKEFSKSEQLTTVKFYGFCAALLSAMTFGCLGLFAHVLYDEGFHVISSLALRFTFAALLLSLLIPFVAPRGTAQAPSFVPRVQNMAMGALGYGVSAGLFFYAMKHTSTGLANILLFQNPAVVFLLTISIGRASPKDVIGLF
jgi:drug/metabolite transporter (DMT)-like permease